MGEGLWVLGPHGGGEEPGLWLRRLYSQVAASVQAPASFWHHDLSVAGVTWAWPRACSLADLWPSVATVITHRPLTNPGNQYTINARLERKEAWESDTWGPSLFPPCCVATLMWPGPRLVQAAWELFFLEIYVGSQGHASYSIRFAYSMPKFGEGKWHVRLTDLPSCPPLPPPSRLENDGFFLYSLIWWSPPSVGQQAFWPSCLVEGHWIQVTVGLSCISVIQS